MKKLIKKEVVDKFSIAEKLIVSTLGATCSSVECISKGGYSIMLELGYNTFWNCQSFTIGNMESLINFFTDDEIIRVINWLKEHTGKYIMIVDVHTGSHTERLRKLGYDIIMDSPYHSTNGSEMSIMMLKVADNDECDEDDSYDDYD